MTFKLKLRKNKISEIASRYEIPWDDQMSELKSAIRERGYLTKGELEVVEAWLRVDPRRRRVGANSPIAVKKATAIALSSRDEREKWRELMKLTGVGRSAASSILHWFADGDYPIASTPALWSCSYEGGRNSFKFWWEYVEFYRQMRAESGNVKSRTFDRALVQYHGEKTK